MAILWPPDSSGLGLTENDHTASVGGMKNGNYMVSSLFCLFYQILSFFCLLTALVDLKQLWVKLLVELQNFGALKKGIKACVPVWVKATRL